jgi:hypothetical protein
MDISQKCVTFSYRFSDELMLLEASDFPRLI